MTPSWDSIRASSWRTLTRRGFAPMTCSACRCTILVKRPMASRREVGGRWRMGFRPDDAWTCQSALHSTHSRKTAPDYSSQSQKTCRHIQYCLYSRNDMFLRWKPTHPWNWPFSFANLHDDGELKYQRTPWTGQIRINLTSAVFYILVADFWLWNNNRLSFFTLVRSVISLFLEYAPWSLIFFILFFLPPLENWCLHSMWCQVALAIQRTQP